MTGIGARARAGAVMSLLLLLYGCGGGGGGGSANVRPDGGGSGAAGSTPSSSATPVVTDGGGVTVAVLDSGVRATHNEFGGGARVLSGYNVADGNADFSDMDSASHGTRVASVALGGSLGVAPGATLLPVRIIKSDGTFTTSEIAAGIEYARTRGAPINNISATVYDTGSIRAALERSAAADVLTVAAAGNYGNPNPVPAQLLDNLSANAVGHFLVVGAIDASDQITAWSDRAGTTMNRYLVARGTSVPSALNTGDDQYGSASGTSFSSPQVAGAAALVKGADPSLSMDSVAEILLRTADDLGAPGVDPVYGWGKLNPSRALQPVGVLGIPDTDAAAGASAPVHATTLRLGSAFGDALSTVPSLTGVVALDEYLRPYRVDLSAGVARANNELDLSQRLAAAGLDRESVQLHIGGMRLQSTWQYAPVPARAAFAGDEDRAEITDHALALSGGSQRWQWEYTAGVAPASRFGAGAWQPLQRLDWLAGDGPGGGYLGLLQNGVEGVALAAGLSPRLGLRLGYFSGESANAWDEAPVRTVLSQLDYALGPVRLRLTAGQLQEQSGILGSYGGGALATGEDAATSSLEMSGLWQWSPRNALTAHYQVGRTAVHSQHSGVLRNWSTLYSDTWGVGAVHSGMFRDDDFIGLRYSQPLRIQRGTVTVDAPLQRDLQHRIARDQTQVSVVPSGMERDLEFAYGFGFGTGGHFTASVVYRSEPGHVQEADSDVAALFSIRQQF